MMEKRHLKSEVRASGDGKKIVGMIPYGKIADLGGFEEVLAPGCFTESLKAGNKVMAFWSHNEAMPLGNSTSGTLQLREDASGLHVELSCDPSTSWGTDALAAVRRGDVGGLSFGFVVSPGGETWTGNLRTLLAVELLEISVVVWPAYQEQNLSVRNNAMKNPQNPPFITVPANQYDSFLEWANESIKPVPNIDPFGGSRSITVEDQPIYRGPAALGQQMVDIIALSRPGAIAPEARSRHEQMVNREKALAEKRAAGTGGMIAGVGQDGGFLLQGETAVEMLTAGFNNSAVLSRSARRNIGNAQFAELVGVDETSRVNGSRGGGVRVYTDAELELIVQSKPKLSKTRLEPKRLTGMYYASNEILDNAPILQQEMASLFNEEFSFKGQDLAINGSGSGEALGILNAPCLVTVPKETGQAAATVLFENLVKMEARLLARNRNALLWLANQNVKPQLYQLALPVGTGGSVMPVFIPSQDPNSEIDGTLLGRPIIFVEQCATIGTVGDIILGDWSAYYAADKGGIEQASSIHLKFDYNQTAFRFVTFFDGSPKLKAAITPYKGTDTVSPFVALAAR